MKRSCVGVAFLVCATFVQQPGATLRRKARRDTWPSRRRCLFGRRAHQGALGDRDDDKPTITYYSPVSPSASGTAVIVAPGGSYQFLTSNHEGRQVANWLNALGVTAFVLKYRLRPRYAPSHRTGRRAARDPHRARPRRGIRHRARSDWHHGLFSRRPSGITDCGNAFR